MLKTSMILILLLILSFDGLAQEPYQLSQEVQAFANEIKLPSKFFLEAGIPTNFQTDRYLDILTVADVMAIERAKAQNRAAPTKEDYAAVFASLCLLPNKPPVDKKLSQFIINDVRPAFSGSYTSEKTRLLIAEAMGPKLRKDSLKEILTDMSKSSFSPSTYSKQIFDVKDFSGSGKLVPGLKK